MSFFARVLICSFSLWLTTLIVGGSGNSGVWVESFAQSSESYVVSLLFVSFIFGVVNATIGRVLKFISIPLTLLTVGIFALILNGALFLFTGQITQLFGFGLHIESFWWGVLGAAFLSLFNAIFTMVFKPKANS